MPLSETELTAKGLYISLDVPEDDLRRVIINTYNVEGVTGYYLGPETGLEMSLGLMVDNINVPSSLSHRSPTIIYDHHSAGTDLPRNAKRLMSTVQRAGAHKVVLYPSTNPVIAEAWIQEAHNHQMDIIIGKENTLESAPTDESFDDVYRLAARLGVREYMMPANKPDRILHYRKIIEDVLKRKPYTIYGSGFGEQGGTVKDFAKAAGVKNGWQLVVGKDIFSSEQPRLMAEKYAEEIQRYSSSRPPRQRIRRNG